jgi:hypothetical protein
MSNLDHVLSEIRSLSPNDLQQLKVVLQTDSAANELVIRGQSTESALGTGDDFDTDLEAIVFDAPPLPASFSRADVYDEHD